MGNSAGVDGIRLDPGIGVSRQSDPLGDVRAYWLSQGWLSSADGIGLVLELFRVNQILSVRLDEVLRPLQLTFARFEVLMNLSWAHGGTLSVGQLGRVLQVHPTSVTNAVDRLEADGLVLKERSREDGRVVLVRLTPLGRTAAGDSTRLLADQVFSQLGLAPAEIGRLWSLLRSFRANSGDFNGPRRLSGRAGGPHPPEALSPNGAPPRPGSPLPA